MPYLDDYGGSRYGGRRRVKREADKIRSFNCNSCHKLFYLSHLEAQRNRPKCPNCGGTGEETDVSLKRRIGLTKKGVSREMARAAYVSYKPNVCRLCEKQFRTSIALKLHYEDSHDIREDF